MFLLLFKKHLWINSLPLLQVKRTGSEDTLKTEDLVLSGLGAGAKETAVLQGGSQGDQEVVTENEPIRKYTEDSGRSSLSAREITKRSESGLRAVTLQRNCRHECELKGVARPHEQVQGLGFQPHLMDPELELPGLCCTSLHPLVTSAGERNQEGRLSPAQPQLESVVTQVFGHSACLQRTESELRNKF